jgi:deoxycytidine triphosphate deaminase
MSLLSYVELCELVHKGVLSNVKPECINAASIDVHLGDEILAECYGDHRLQIVDLSVKPRQSVQRSSHNIKDGYFDMLPMTGALAHTMEKFYLPDNIVAEYYLNSSLARNHLEHLHAGHCFVAGTMVPMLDGTEKRIEEIQVGDYVYSIDPATGTPKPGKVTFSGKTAEVLKTARVTLDNGEVVESTDDHLYLCRNGRYVEAKALKTGDALMPLRRKIQQGYENHSVVKIEFVEHEKPVPVFDITVDEHHNFALSAGVFVHNCDPGWNDSTLTLELVNLNRYHTLRLRPGQRIGQMLFYRVTEVPEHRSYATIGNYNGDAGVGRVKGS